ncbi:MAG: hypothetical protein RBT76_07660 [candidate division Zixibacteria bacterium]|nr:hypothetical protein [candidate division Zixibacteria bacterium]
MTKAIMSIVAILLLVSCSSGDSGTNSGGGNKAPVAPSNPHPASGASNVSTTTQLAWQCSDPEGDSITYDVSLGTSNPPPVVSNDQASSSYAPGQLATSTTYYWKVTATDVKGASASGPVWSFSTVGNQAPTIPSDPVPTNGSTGQDTAGITLRWQCSDPDGDPVSSDLYFGTGTNPPLVKSNLTQQMYQATGGDWFNQLSYNTTYYWKIVAKDNHGHERSGPVWSFKTIQEVQLVGRFSTAGFVTTVAVSGDWAYLLNAGSTNFSARIQVVNVASPSQPYLAATRQTSSVSDLTLRGTSLFLLRDRVLEVFDISTPNVIQPIGQVLTIGTTAFWGLCADGNILYLSTFADSSGKGYVEIIDVSTPASPQHLGAITRSRVGNIAATNGYLYIADFDGGAVYNVSSPATPTVVSSQFTKDDWAIQVFGNQVFTGSGGRMQIFDVTSPAQPTLTGTYQPTDGFNASGIDVSDNIACVSSVHYLKKGLFVLDVSNPAQPSRIGHYYANHSGSGLGGTRVDIVGDYVYLAALDEGLLVLRLP